MKELNKYGKKILVTGGAGFIGSHLVRHLVNKYPDYLIVNFDALTYAGNLESLKDVENKANYEFVKGDIRDQEFIVNTFKCFGITDIIHMAAESHVDRSMVNPTIFAETNVMGTLNLLNTAREYWKEDYTQHVFFNMGTDEIYGALGIDDEPFNENTPLNPHSPYSTSKTAQVMFGKTYYEAYGVQVVSLACGNAIGPNQFPEKLVPLTIDRLLNEKEIPVYGKGEQMRDWTFVTDICDAIDVIFHKGTPGELYCIGGDACTKNIDIIKDIIKVFSKETILTGRVTDEKINENIQKYEKLIKFIPDPRGKSHDFRYDLDHSKITNELGWTPKHTYSQSVEETVKWYLNNIEWTEHCKSGEYQDWINKYY